MMNTYRVYPKFKVLETLFFRQLIVMINQDYLLRTDCYYL